MLNKPLEVDISVTTKGGAEKNDEKCRSLAEELRERGLSVSLRTPVSTTSSNAKDVPTAIGLGQILLSLASSTVLVAVITATKEWLIRQPPNTSIKMKLRNTELEISGPLTPQFEYQVKSFLDKVSSVE